MSGSVDLVDPVLVEQQSIEGAELCRAVWPGKLGLRLVENVRCEPAGRPISTSTG